MKLAIKIILVAGLALLAAVTHAKETGTTRYAVDLLAAPYRDAQQESQLAGNARVDILERRGGWLKVSAKNRTGWVRLHQVRIGEGSANKKSGSQGLGVLKNIGKTGRSGSQGIVATTGIRGLSAEELKSAKPNPQAVQALEAHSSSDDAARTFAHSAGLKEKDVAFLNKPQ